MTQAMPELTLEQQLQVKHAAASLQSEFSGIFSSETIERFLAESIASMAQAKVSSFIPLLGERFARTRLKALARVEGKVESETPMVLFLCVHNAGRSQMGAGWLTHLGGDDVEVFSGGSDPGSEVNPAAIEAMAEVGIDISTNYPKPWTDEIVRAADVVITMGCGDSCPIFPGKRYEDWEVSDPAGLGVEAVRPIRDELKERVVGLMESLEIPVRT